MVRDTGRRRGQGRRGAMDYATQGRGDPAMEEMLAQPGGCHFHRDRVAPSSRPLRQPLVVAPPTVV